MNRCTLSCIGTTSLLAFVMLAVPARADSIAITYSLAGTGTVKNSTSTTLTLVAAASGSVLSSNPGLNAAWNPVSYSDESVLNLNTGLLNGNFTMTFEDGDTLVGKVFENDSAIVTSPTQTGPFTQTLAFTGGTGEFAGATGSVSGDGFIGTATFTVSGSGTVNTSSVPEPASASLIFGGFGLVVAGAWRRARKRAAAC